MTYETRMPAKLTLEFPDFDSATLPAIPADWVDISWHNDACPSFEVASVNVTVFVDYLDPALRETKGGKRFNVLSIADADLDRCLLSTDAWGDVLTLITKMETGA